MRRRDTCDCCLGGRMLIGGNWHEAEDVQRDEASEEPVTSN
jgi:hypothetical protein